MIIMPLMENSLTLSSGLRKPQLLLHDDTVGDSPMIIGIRSGSGAAKTVRMRPNSSYIPYAALPVPTLLNCLTGVRI